MTEWRELLYPLGLLSSLAFGGRSLVQWLGSEIKKESTVTRTFWQISLFGNVMLLLHSLIQIQYHVFIIQVCNAVISWRNLNLMNPNGSSINRRQVMMLIVGLIIISTGSFIAINNLWNEALDAWFRIPSFSWLTSSQKPVGTLWHVIGFIGLGLFASRFWIQWWNAEKKKESYLGPVFWWISLVGDLMTLIYFARIKDPVNLIGPAFGLIPYIRNLMLLKQAKALKET